MSNLISFSDPSQFEIGIPSDGTNQRRHALRFSCLESSAEFDSPGNSHPFSSSSSRTPSPSLLSSSPASQPPALEADDVSSTSSASSSGSAVSSDSAGSQSRWAAPRATFEFSAKDVPFPIDIETPFESFQTVLWSVSMKRRAMDSPQDGISAKRDGAGMAGRGFTYRYNSTITKGLERVSYIDMPIILNKYLTIFDLDHTLPQIRQSSFADKPVPQVLPLSDSPTTTSSYNSTTSSSALKMTMLPASAVHYKGTVNHGGDPWDIPTFVGPAGASRTGGVPRAPRRVSSFDSVPGQLGEDNEEDVDADVLDWRRQPCTCGARDTYGIQFEKLSLNCGYILKAHEDVVLAEVQRRVKVVTI